jgi:hypothetical protein
MTRRRAPPPFSYRKIDLDPPPWTLDARSSAAACPRLALWRGARLSVIKVKVFVHGCCGDARSACDSTGAMG